MTNFSELILGGARSGKSRLAESQALATGKNCIYLATAQSGDAEMQTRIKAHQSRRGSEWALVEEPLALAQALAQHSAVDCCLLVDCLTLWLSNCLHEGQWVERRSALLDILPQLPGHTIFVSNEVGMGIVPMGELSRQFVDESGFLHQALGQVCDRVTFMAAGLPMVLKGQ